MLFGHTGELSHSRRENAGREFCPEYGAAPRGGYVFAVIAADSRGHVAESKSLTNVR